MKAKKKAKNKIKFVSKVWNCKKIRCRNSGKDTYILYARPVTKGNLKHFGKFLEIESGGFKIMLNGRQINSVKRVLKDVGEIGGRINRKKCRIW